MSKMSFNSNVVVLQSCPSMHIMFYRLQKTSLFGRDRCNNHTIILSYFFMKMRIILSKVKFV